MSRTGPDPPRRPAFGDLKQRLSRAGFRPSKRFGQNFLLDENLVEAIVRDAGVGPDDRVLEVGAGLGFLTWHLLDAGADVVAVEVDLRLAELARELLGEHPRLCWILGDVLESKHRLAPEVREALAREEPWHLVANLPYGVASPLLANLTRLPVPPVSMTVLVQKEVAERIAAHPGSADWGPLSVRLQRDYEVEFGRRVPASLFWPRPRVESATVRLVRRPEAPAARGGEGEFDRLVTALFQRRRQTLGRVLGDLLGDKGTARGILEGLGLTASERAENLDLGDLEKLSEAVRASGRGGG